MKWVPASYGGNCNAGQWSFVDGRSQLDDYLDSGAPASERLGLTANDKRRSDSSTVKAAESQRSRPSEKLEPFPRGRKADSATASQLGWRRLPA